MLTIKQFVRRLAKSDGAEIAEAALVLPLVFMLLLGVVWFGRAFNIYSTIQQAAQQGAITAARSTCVTCGNNPNGNVYTTIKAVLQASNLSPSDIQLPASAPTCGTLPCSACLPSPPWPPGGACTPTNGVYICQNVQLNPGAAQPLQCGSVVSFQYPFQFFLPFTSLNMQPVVMSAQAQSRMEN